MVIRRKTPNEMKPLLLAIDDQLSMRSFLEYYLSETYQVVTQPDGLSALAWIEAGHQPDVIVADLDMPGMKGTKLLDILRASEATAAVPYLVLSGMDESSARVEALEKGADDYVVKPFHPRELQLRIRNLLHRKSIAA